MVWEWPVSSGGECEIMWSVTNPIGRALGAFFIRASGMAVAFTPLYRGAWR